MGRPLCHLGPKDIVHQLKLPQVRQLHADMATCPIWPKVNPDHDVVLPERHHHVGVKAPHDWIAADRAGLTICDATSAVFAMDLPLGKLDVVTFSGKKCSVVRVRTACWSGARAPSSDLESYTAPGHCPRSFALTAKASSSRAFSVTPSTHRPCCCVADYLDALAW